MKLLTILVALLATAISVHAGHSHGEKVRHIMIHPGEVVMFNAGTHHNKPACSTAGDDWAFSLTTEQGKAMYAMLLSAAAQALPVFIEGEGVCNIWGDRESPGYIWVVYPE